MEESEKPKNITNCDNSKKDNSNVINHLDDDDSVTKNEVDNETETVSADKTSREDIKVVSMDGKNASNTEKEKRGYNSIDPQKSLQKMPQLREEKNDSKVSEEAKSLKENSLLTKSDIPQGDISLLNNKESESCGDKSGINKGRLDKEEVESSFNLQSSKLSNKDDKAGQKDGEDEPASSSKNAPPLPRRQSLDKKVRTKFIYLPSHYLKL